jgi:hypothetical protein
VTLLFVKSVMNMAPLEDGGGGGAGEVDELLQPVAASKPITSVAAVTEKKADRCDLMGSLLYP